MRTRGMVVVEGESEAVEAVVETVEDLASFLGIAAIEAEGESEGKVDGGGV